MNILNELCVLLKEEYREGPMMILNNDQKIMIELACYSSKMKELYCVNYQVMGNKCFLVTFSLMNNRALLKNRKQLTMKMFGYNMINRIILHKVNQSQLALIGVNSLAIIKSVNAFAKEDNDSQMYYKSYDDNATINDFSFGNYDDHYGVLLSNGSFYYDSINQYEKHVCFHIFHYADILSFNFFSLDNEGWENFMIMFMGKNGRFYLTGPVFPNEFNIEEEYLITMKHKYPNNQILSLINNAIIDSTLHKGIIIKSTPALLNYNNNLMIREMIVNKITSPTPSMLQLNMSNEYRHFIILKNKPVTLLRISANNIIEVIIISNELQPVINPSIINNTIAIEYNQMFIVEQIPLSSNPSTSLPLLYTQIHCHEISDDEIILEQSSNVYHITLPYRKTLLKYINKPNDNDKNNNNQMHIHQFNSMVNQLIKYNASSYKITLNFFIADILIQGKYTMITYINNTFKHYSIALKTNDENLWLNHWKGSHFLTKSKEKNDQGVILSQSKEVYASQNKKEDCLVIKTMNHLLFNEHFFADSNVLGNNKYNNNLKDHNLNGSFRNNHNELYQYYHHLIESSIKGLNLLNPTFKKTKDHLNRLNERGQLIPKLLNHSITNNYLHKMQTMNVLSKDILMKKHLIKQKKDSINALLKLKKINSSPENIIISKQISQYKKIMTELAYSSKEINDLIKKLMKNLTKKLKIEIVIEMSSINQTNITKGQYLWNEIDLFLKHLTTIKASL